METFMTFIIRTELKKKSLDYVERFRPYDLYKKIKYFIQSFSIRETAFHFFTRNQELLLYQEIQI